MKPIRSRLIFMYSAILASVVAAILRWQFPPEHSTVALVQIPNKSSLNVFLHPDQKPTTYDRQAFLKSQLSLIRSAFVIKSALNSQGISELECVIKNKPNAVK